MSRGFRPLPSRDRCAAIEADEGGRFGRRCRARSVEGSDLCPIHAARAQAGVRLARVRPATLPRCAALCVALAMLLAWPTPARCDEVTADVVTLGLAAAADTMSTHYALSECAGCREGNVLMSEPAGALLLKAGAVAATSLLASKLRKDGHGRAAKILRWTTVAVWGSLALHNMRTAQAAAKRR